MSENKMQEREILHRSKEIPFLIHILEIKENSFGDREQEITGHEIEMKRIPKDYYIIT